MGVHVLDFARPDQWLNANTREHWSIKAAKVRAWRAAAAANAKGLPSMTRIEVIAQPRWTSRRRHDNGNIAPTVKACVDGLVDAGVLVDDSSRIVVSESYQEGPPTKGVARLRLIIVDRSDCAGPFTEATWADHQAACDPCGVPFWRIGGAALVSRAASAADARSGVPSAAGDAPTRPYVPSLRRVPRDRP